MVKFETMRTATVATVTADNQQLIEKYFGNQFWQGLGSLDATPKIVRDAQDFLKKYPSTLVVGVDLRVENLSSFSEVLAVFCAQLDVSKNKLSYVLNSMSDRTYCVCVLGLHRLSVKDKLWYLWFRQMLIDSNHVVFDDFSLA